MTDVLNNWKLPYDEVEEESEDDIRSIYEEGIKVMAEWEKRKKDAG